MQQHMQEGKPGKQGHYGRLMVMVALSFVAMYILMYAMVNRFENVFNNINQAYMAGLMAAPMLGIELVLMGSMYPNKKLNAVLLVASLAALALFWALIRTQAAVGDRQHEHVGVGVERGQPVVRHAAEHLHPRHARGTAVQPG